MTDEGRESWRRLLTFVRNHKYLEDVEKLELESIIAADRVKPDRQCVCRYYNGESRKDIFGSGIVPT